MHVVFRHDRDVVSKNPGGGVDPTRVARWARRQGVLSLGYLFFARAKKSSSLPDRGAKASALATALFPRRRKGSSRKQKPESRAFTPASQERATFLCSCKETWPKESTAGREPMRLRRIGPLRSSRDRGTAHNSLRSDTCASSPPVPLRCSARSTAGKSKATATAIAEATAKAPSPTSYAQGRGKAGIPRDSTCCAFITPSIAEEHP